MAPVELSVWFSSRWEIRRITLDGVTTEIISLHLLAQIDQNVRKTSSWAPSFFFYKKKQPSLPVDHGEKINLSNTTALTK